VARDDKRSWALQKGAVEITCVVQDAGEATHVGGELPDGTKWQLSVEALVEAIDGGTVYYVELHGNAYLVQVDHQEPERPLLNAGLKEPGLLLQLPHCSH
jgi:hypothetical protein